MFDSIRMTARHILAMGGLVSDTNSTAMFEYALRLSQKAYPAIGFLATASGDSPAFLAKFYETFRPLACKPTHLPLFERTPNVAEFVSELDVILVGGGNTISMLGAWQPWGIAAALRAGWERGLVVAGWSAGALCWFQSGLSDAHAGRLAAVEGLGLLPGSCCPHFSQDAARRAAFTEKVAAGDMPPGWGIAAGAALHFEGTAPRTLLKVPGTAGATFVAPAAVAPPALAEFVLPAD
jgi:dipeptidase E